MRRKLGMGVAWLVATVASVLIASVAVAGVRDRVVETPPAIGAPTTTTTTTVAADATTSTVVPPATTTTTSTTSTTAPTDVTATTVADAQTTTTTTTAPPQTTTTTTTTTAAPALTRKSFSLVGGTVIIEFGGGEVWLVSAVANNGFYPEVEKGGPDEVHVEFEGEEHKSEFSAHMEGGQLKHSIDEEGEGDDDGGGGEHDD